MAAQKTFLTGGSGFIGTALRAQLADTGQVLAGVLRNPARADAGPGFVAGDLLAPDSYRDALAGADTVVHLAALTGKAPADVHRKVNAEGTRALIEASRQAGVRHFLHVSSIAAGYADKRHYPYAESKAEAEQLVRDSGIPFTILRPTVVLGPDSPIWATLKKVASLPVIPLPQDRQPVTMQPVLVDDVARAIAIVLEEGRFDGETLEIGGADPETFAHFLREVRRALKGKPAPVMTIPLGLPRALLAAIEPVARPVLPVTAGQLALFANDSTAAPSWLMDRLRPTMPNLSMLLGQLADSDRSEGAEGGHSSAPDQPAVLEREAHVFARYLTGNPAGPAALRHYVAANRAHGLASDAGLPIADRRALALARRGPALTRCVDAVCALLARRGALRRKLIIMAAILESQVPTNAVFEEPQSPGPVASLFQLAGHGIAFAGALVAGVVMVGVARLAGVGRA